MTKLEIKKLSIEKKIEKLRIRRKPIDAKINLLEWELDKIEYELRTPEQILKDNNYI